MFTNVYYYYKLLLIVICFFASSDTALLLGVLSEAESLGFSEVYLWSGLTSAPLTKQHAAIGFSPVFVFDNPIIDGLPAPQALLWIAPADSSLRQAFKRGKPSQLDLGFRVWGLGCGVCAAAAEALWLPQGVSQGLWFILVRCLLLWGLLHAVSEGVKIISFENATDERRKKLQASWPIASTASTKPSDFAGSPTLSFIGDS